MRRLAILFLVAACGSDASDPAVPCGVAGVTGDVPGIAISIRSGSCTYAAGSPATFTYDIVVDASVPTLHYAAEMTTCTARPHPYTTDPTTLIRSTLHDTESAFCWDCDFECAPAEGAVTLELAPGTTSGTLAWPGTEGSPAYHGDVFAPGEYAVRVSFNGGDAGSTVAELPITIE